MKTNQPEQRESTVEKIKLTAIKVDPELQPRARMDEGTIVEYRDELAAKHFWDFPPGKAVKDKKGVIWLWDGFHRYEGYRRAGRQGMPLEVTEGEREDALLLSLGANATHGLKRTNEDKRRAVSIALKHKEWREWSDKKISNACGVSHTFVAEVRRSLATVASEESKRTYTTKHGTTAVMDTSKIGKGKSKDTESHEDTSTSGPPADSNGHAPKGSLSDPAPSQAPGAAGQNGHAAVATQDAKDVAGHTIPKSLRPSFAALSKFEEMDSLCRKLQSLIDQVVREPGGEKLKRFVSPYQSGEKPIYKSEHLEALKRDLKALRPHAVCPGCIGKANKDCKLCSGFGWVEPVTWKNTEPHIKARLAV